MNEYICKIGYQFDFEDNYIIAHIQQIKELEKILEKSGYKKEFIKKFRNRLKFLADRKENCYQKSEWFEILKGKSQLSSMKIKRKKNIRILFSFFRDNGKDFVILLVSFEEKRKKDYDSQIITATERLKELID